MGLLQRIKERLKADIKQGRNLVNNTEKKVGNYFGVGRPGLGTFGQQVSRTYRPIVNELKQAPNSVRNNVFRPVVSSVRKQITNPNSGFNKIADLATQSNEKSYGGIARGGMNIASAVAPKYRTQIQNFSKIAAPDTEAKTKWGRVGDTMGRYQKGITEFVGTLPIGGGSATVGASALKGLSRQATNPIVAARLAKASNAAKWAGRGIDVAKGSLINAGLQGVSEVGRTGDIKQFGKGAKEGAISSALFGTALELGGAGVEKISDILQTRKAIKSIINPSVRKKAMGEFKNRLLGEVPSFGMTTKSVNEGLDALSNEARKYKSAEEFIRAQGQPYFHGTDVKWNGEFAKPNGEPGSEAIFIAPSSANAQYYVRTPKGEIKNVYLDKNAKLWDYNNPSDVKALQDKVKEFIPENKDIQTRIKLNIEKDKIIKRATYKNHVLTIQQSDLPRYNQITKDLESLGRSSGSDSVTLSSKIPNGYYTDISEALKNPKVKEWFKSNYDGWKQIDHTDYGNDVSIGIFDPKTVKTEQRLKEIYNQVSQPLSTPKTAEAGATLPKDAKKIQLVSKPEATEGIKVLESVPTKPVSEPKVQIQMIKPTPENKLPLKTVQEVSDKTASDVSLESIIQKSPTDVKSKVNIIDMFRTPDRVLNKIGLGEEAKTLRTQYEKYLKELPQEIDKIGQWAKQTTPEENTRIFKFLDGQKVDLTTKETKIANEVKDYLKQWADKLNLPQDKRITNYITHIFDKDLIKKEFPEELAKIIDEKVAGSVYDPFVLERLGKKGYIEDTWRALDAYVKRATRKANIDVALESIKSKAERLELSQFKYVKNYIDRINMRPTELDNMIDNFIKSSPVGYKLGQRPTANLTKNARQMVYRGTLGLNVGSTLKNLSQGANTYARLGERYTVKGYIDLFKNFRSNELKEVGVLADDLVQDRNLGVYKGFLEKADKALFYLFETAEKINRGAAYYGAKAKALNEGKSIEQAIEFAKKTVRDTQFTFGSIDTPPILQSDAAKTLLQFQSFNIKQGEFLGEMISKKDFAGLTRWIGASLAFVYGVGKMMGMKPSDIIPTLRVGRSPFFTTAKETYNAITNAPDEYGNKPENAKERFKPLLKSLVPLAPGGVQIKKSIEGLSATNKGYVETAKGLVRNPVAKTVENTVRGALFGQNNLPESQKYFQNKETPLGKKQSEIFKLIGNNKDYYNKVMSDRETNKQDEKDKKALKTGNGKVQAQDLENGTYKLSSGKIYVPELDKEFATPQKAKIAIGEKVFEDSGKKSGVVDGIYYFQKDDGTTGHYTESEVNSKIRNQQMEKAKESNDYKSWLNLAQEKEKDLQKQWQEANGDQLAQLEIENELIDLYQNMAKYASYGGFKKGKKAKKYNLASVNNVQIKASRPQYTTKIRTQRPKTVKFKSPKIKTYKLKAQKAPKLSKLRSY